MRWWGRASRILAFALLGVFLCLDREYKVLDAFPLKHHPTSPFSAFLLLGTVCYPLGASLLLVTLRNGRLAAQSPSWPTVDGTVLESDVATTWGRGAHNWVRVRYEYAVDGRRYESGRVFFSQAAYPFRATAEAVTERFPVGARPTVHYESDDPSIAVLDTSADQVDGSLWWAVIMLLFPLLGFVQAFRDLLNG